MKSTILLLLICCSAASLERPEGIFSSPKDRFSVYLFLHDDCVISQYYTLTLRNLHQEYASDHLQFVGLFPNFSSKPAEIAAFKEKYQLPFDLKTDYYHTFTKAFGATVTPEVVVYNETRRAIVYQGRIDNTYARVGKRRRFPTTAELKEVLSAISQNQPIDTGTHPTCGLFYWSQ